MTVTKHRDKFIDVVRIFRTIENRILYRIVQIFRLNFDYTQLHRETTSSYGRLGIVMHFQKKFCDAELHSA